MIKSKNGFTLVEILVSITIVGILMGISFFGIQGARTSARDTKRKADLETIRSALELYKADNNEYPLHVVEASGWEVSNDATPDFLENLPSQYLPKKPFDPVNDATYYYRYSLCSGTATLTGLPTYKIQAFLEGGETGRTCTQCSGNTGGGGWECLTNP